METDAQRQHDIQKEGARRFAERHCEIRRQEVVVLEKAQEAEIRRQAADQNGAALACRLGAFEPHSGSKIDGGKRKQKRDELGVPTAVKEVARNQQQILAEPAGQQIEQRQNDGQKNEKAEGVEQHGLAGWSDHARDFTRQHG